MNRDSIKAKRIKIVQLIRKHIKNTCRSTVQISAIFPLAASSILKLWPSPTERTAQQHISTCVTSSRSTKCSAHVNGGSCTPVQMIWQIFLVIFLNLTPLWVKGFDKRQNAIWRHVTAVCNFKGSFNAHKNTE